jgi:phosphatidylserine/phosphatidylglycerophosphate/cardiolipin synthase-like enzyme
VDGANEQRAVEAVVTVPDSLGPAFVSRFRMRTTLGVLTELLASARHEVVLGAPFVQGAEGLLAGPLGMALDACLRRGARVDLISTGASLAGLDLRNLRRAAAGRLRTFQPRSNVEDPRVLGSHAKFCLIDGEHAYIGSANITQKGISGHLEMGVLAHGAVPQQLAGLIRALLESEYFVEVLARE